MEDYRHCSFKPDFAPCGVFKEQTTSFTSHTESVSVDEGSQECSDEEYQFDIRGRCKSGRIWKSQKSRFRGIIKTKGLQSSLEKRIEIQEDKRKAKQLTRDNLDERRKRREEQRHRQKENHKKREENRKKSEIVQVVKNPSKIKKKHLAMIEKRDTLPLINLTRD